MASAIAAPAYDEDWEEYNPASGLTFTHHMIAGSCAGLVEHVLMFPVDTVKVGVQREPGRSGLGPSLTTPRTARSVDRRDSPDAPASAAQRARRPVAESALRVVRGSFAGAAGVAEA